MAAFKSEMGAVEMVDIGRHRLKGLRGPIRIYHCW
jgi:hypothetical protein